MNKTSRTISKCIYEHNRDFKLGDSCYSLVKYYLETDQSFNCWDSKMIIRIHNNQHRKIVESNIISNYNMIKQRPYTINLSLSFVELVLNRYNIHYIN